MRESEYRRNDKKPQGKFIVRRDETLSAVFGVLIFVALGIGFGKIVGVDSANDPRTIEAAGRRSAPSSKKTPASTASRP